MLTAAQKIKRELVLTAIANNDLDIDLKIEPTTDDPVAIEDAYDAFCNSDMSDYVSEFRNGWVETNIPSPSSRHYESKSVASQLSDGTWVGWTYWYGGGKHGCPKEINWIDDAYNLEMTERQEMVTVRTFTKVD